MKLSGIHQTELNQQDVETGGENNPAFGSSDSGFTGPEVKGKQVSEGKTISGINANSVVIVNQTPIETKVYFRRWVILALFATNSMLSAFQWIEYSIITDIICKYYDVLPTAVNWTSMVYMVAYIPLIFPATWFLGKKGLRWTVLLGSFGTMLGAWIKCASISPDRFYVTMIGQTICGISQIFILGIPSQLAAFWFGPQQVSTACAIGVFGNQMGSALGFLIPPFLVPNSEDIAEIGHGLRLLFYIIAGAVTATFILTLLFFKAKPPRPPSPAAVAAATNVENEKYLQSIGRLFKNINYILLLLSYGINVGVYYAVSTLLSQVFLKYFPGESQNAGFIGLTIVLAGMGGSVLSGIVLDKTHKFKETTVVIYLFTLLGMVGYTVNFLAYQIWLVFVIAGLLGFFMTGYLPVGFEFAAEITYPEPEGTSSGLLNASCQVFGIIFTLVGGWLIDSVSDIASNSVMCGVLVVGLLMTVFVKADLRRRAAQSASSTTTSVAEYLTPTENGFTLV